MHRTITLIAALLLAAPALAASDRAESPAVAAASDLRFALDELVAGFERDTGLTLRVTYGSSGNFARQIAQGAPFELFLSADESFVFALADRGLTRDRGHLYAVGRLVLYAPAGSPLEPDAKLEHLARRLADGSSGRIAIANPDHAPYGRAAQQALEALGLWQAAQAHLVLGENVSQAAQFAASGDADGGIIAYSLVRGAPLRDGGRYALIPASLHVPLRQRMVLLRRASPAAARFYEYLRSPASRAILARYGFESPVD
jgi:molybdate transport system substrate-binding protein